jgi:ATP-binding cassette subfamily F protein 3
LDVTVTRILEMWNKKTNFYTGNYDKYLRQKNERREQLQADYKAQRDRIEQVEAFINRFRYQATKAKQVQSRIKELEKIDRIEIPDEEKIIHFNFPQPRQSGRIVAEMKNVAKDYGEKHVLGNVNFVLNRGDRVALLGVNGAGKSTLIKLLSATEPPTSGEFRLGHNVDVDYFAQDQYKALDPNARLLDDLASVAPASESHQTRLRSILGSFLFSDDEVFKRIGVLSGGERNRYALARMLLQPANLLLLDEPTNHLDLQAKDVLLGALQKFTGTVVFVSHDRYFIDKLATRVFHIENYTLEDYPGNYEDYLWQRDRQAADPSLASRHGNGFGAAAASGPKREDPPAKKVNPMVIRKMEERCGHLEEEIARVEAEIATYEQELAAFKSAQESIRLAALIEERRARLKKITREWEETAANLELQR